MTRSILAWTILAFLFHVPRAAFAQPTGSTWIGGRPDATIDLTTVAGAALVKAEWRYSEAKVISIESRAIGADLKPSGDMIAANDIEPKAGAADFDDSNWEIIMPPQPKDRRTAGRLSFAWFRTSLTIPEQVGELNSAGTNVVLETVVDDYAEIWVDGKLIDEVFGQSGGSMVRGWNAPNRVVVARDAKPGQVIQLAIFAMNGPISEPPANFIWFRSAALDFFKPVMPESVLADVVRMDPALDEIISRDARIEKLAGGFSFTEGPVWVPAADGSGFLLFSDPNENTIYRLNRDNELFEYRVKSGYSGTDIGRYRQPGSNGLALDGEGRLTICQHGNRQIIRIERNGLVMVLADRFEGKRLNSPNDLVYRSDGMLFITDPPFGLPGFDADPAKELDFSGVYCLIDGKLKLVDDSLSGPNGIAFSPDEKYLYVGNWDDKHKTVSRYEIATDGTVVNKDLFFDLTATLGEDAIDGIKVDRLGNVYVSGPGGLWVLSPEGQHLGTIVPPEHPHNMAFGGDDGQTLFMTCQTGVYSMRLNVSGATTKAGSNIMASGDANMRRK